MGTQHKLKEPVPIWKLNSKEGKNLKKRLLKKVKQIMSEYPSAAIGSWQGLTIKEILEKVDLSNIINEDMDKNKEEKLNDPMFNSGSINPESAFLGPKLWSRPVQMPITNDSDEEFAVMNIDDFLNENGFDFEDQQSNTEVQSPQSSTSSNDMDTEEQTDEPPAKKSKKKIDTTFLYVESKRARQEREKEEKKRKSVIDMEFSARDLALATVPGMEFDPRERAFNVEELKPQPIIRKRKKNYVPSESKDMCYWEKRNKNNEAARRSREARRLKENQIALRTAFLEKENAQLKAALDEMTAENSTFKMENEILQKKLKQYENKK